MHFLSLKGSFPLPWATPGRTAYPPLCLDLWRVHIAANRLRQSAGASPGVRALGQSLATAPKRLFLRIARLGSVSGRGATLQPSEPNDCSQRADRAPNRTVRTCDPPVNVKGPEV